MTGWLLLLTGGMVVLSGIMLARGIYNGDWPTGYSDENKAAKEREEE